MFRPSGEMCWMFRLHNGQIANQNFCLKDISDILFPSPQIETKIKVIITPIIQFFAICMRHL